MRILGKIWGSRDCFRGHIRNTVGKKLSMKKKKKDLVIEHNPSGGLLHL